MGYRNSWGIILFNTSEETFEIAQGDRIAQVVFNKCETVEWNEVTSLDETERGLTGYGDSGVKIQ